MWEVSSLKIEGKGLKPEFGREKFHICDQAL